MSNTNDIWTREEVADYYRVSLRTVGNWIADRKIPRLKIGKTVRFRAEEVRRAISKLEQKEAA